MYKKFTTLDPSCTSLARCKNLWCHQDIKTHFLELLEYCILHPAKSGVVSGFLYQHVCEYLENVLVNSQVDSHTGFLDLVTLNPDMINKYIKSA